MVRQAIVTLKQSPFSQICMMNIMDLDTTNNVVLAKHFQFQPFFLILPINRNKIFEVYLTFVNNVLQINIFYKL